MNIVKIGILYLAAVSTFILAFVANTSYHETFKDPTGNLIPQCASDDGTSKLGYPCVWDARKHGNGQGRSYLSFGEEGPFITL